MNSIKTYIIGLLSILFNLNIVNAQKIEICHIPPGNPFNSHTISVDSNSINAHLSHGDYIGKCDTSNIDSVKIFQIQVFPNPYFGFTNIEYTLPENGYMLIEIYNQDPHKIYTIIDGLQIIGSYLYQFSATNLGYSPGYYLLVYNFWGNQNYNGTIVLFEF